MSDALMTINLEALADRIAERLAERMQISAAPTAEAKPWLDTKEAAEHLGLSTAELERYRRNGGGPKFCRPSAKVVRYHVSDLDAWMRSQKA